MPPVNTARQLPIAAPEPTPEPTWEFSRNNRGSDYRKYLKNPSDKIQLFEYPLSLRSNSEPRYSYIFSRYFEKPESALFVFDQPYVSGAQQSPTIPAGVYKKNTVYTVVDWASGGEYVNNYVLVDFYTAQQILTDRAANLTEAQKFWRQKWLQAHEYLMTTIANAIGVDELTNKFTSIGTWVLISQTVAPISAGQGASTSTSDLGLLPEKTKKSKFPLLLIAAAALGWFIL
jgi:hypothetical protein